MNSQPTILMIAASHGLDYELASEFAQNGHPLVLVGPIDPDLRNLASRLKDEFGVEAHPIATDLRNEQSLRELLGHIAARGGNIELLVNCVSPVNHDDENDESDLHPALASLAHDLQTIERLTDVFLPTLCQRGLTRVLNAFSTGSLGLIASAHSDETPLVALYEAAKESTAAWTDKFAAKLRDSGVTVITRWSEPPALVTPAAASASVQSNTPIPFEMASEEARNESPENAPVDVEKQTA